MRVNKNYDFKRTDYENLKISDLKTMTDYWFRQYLLKKAERNSLNRIYCPLKKKWYPEEKINVSHYIDRGVMNTRWSEENCHLLSEQSNVWDSKEMVEGYKSRHHKEFEEYLGEEKVKKLLEESKIIRIFARKDYINLIEKFRDNE